MGSDVTTRSKHSRDRCNNGRWTLSAIINYIAYNIVSITDALIPQWSGFEWYSLTFNSIFLILFAIIAITALVKSQEWMEMKRATDADGQLTEESWLVFCT